MIDEKRNIVSKEVKFIKDWYESQKNKKDKPILFYNLKFVKELIDNNLKLKDNKKINFQNIKNIILFFTANGNNNKPDIDFEINNEKEIYSTRIAGCIKKSLKFECVVLNYDKKNKGFIEIDL